MTTNLKGQIAQTKVELRALEKGIIPSKPLFDCRYDLIFDNGISLQKIQIKYGDGSRIQNRGIITVGVSYRDRKKRVKTYTQDEIDAIIVYLPKIEKFCWLSPELFINKTIISIRYLPSKNNQIKNCLFLKDIEW